jgi:hypothetical protein
MIDKKVPHYTRHQSKKMTAISYVHAGGFDQPQIRFMYESCRIKRRIGVTPQSMSCKEYQALIYQRDQFVQRTAVTLFPPAEKDSDVDRFSHDVSIRREAADQRVIPRIAPQFVEDGIYAEELNRKLSACRHGEQQLYQVE